MYEFGFGKLGFQYLYINIFNGNKLSLIQLYTPESVNTTSSGYQGSTLRLTLLYTLGQINAIAKEFTNISGIVTGAYKQNWWLGCVLQVESEDPLDTKHSCSLQLIQISHSF